ncbi:fructosamine kinase family protein [Marinobacter sp. HL-58]|uniref:fructosamine kinase family protein n=1 Tax=Marinobacter sp. HL-58 TaxID=1479237 RepID=UPI0006D9915F|nr:fructosamine kinase family protein [Marinobacter sp. HL-58]KPQ00200.1 MAG: Fructosamine-3-kinase [Marinobacter sp. HL-58]
MADFVKHNTTPFPDALLREAEGLALLADTLGDAGVTAVRVPQVRSVSKQALVIPRISPGRATEESMAQLGDGLARMHAVRQKHYGLETDNLIGLSRQTNGVSDDWGDFFLRKRLEVQVAMIRDRSVRGEFEAVLECRGEALTDFLNEHCAFPSLLHGDLWSGNALFDEQGPWLIDPAVYYGDREADIAMTELFGGFSQAFYQAYDRALPRTPAYDTKRDIYNLYHTLNHFNLFGASYLGACRRNLETIRQL